MNNKKILILEGKRLLKSIPGILAGAISLMAIISAIAFCSIYYYSKHPESPLLKVGLVSISESDRTYALTIADSYKATNQFFNFVIYDSEQSALSDLNDHILTAVISMPENVIASILNGDNYHVTIYFRNMNNTTDLLLYEFSKAGASILSSAQSDIYTISDVYISYDLSQYLDDVFLDLNITNLQYALVSDTLFQTISLTPTGSSVLNFYLTAAYITILSLMGLSFATFLSPYPRDIMLLLNRSYITHRKIYCIRFLYLLICNFLLSSVLRILLYLFSNTKIQFSLTSCFVYLITALFNSVLFLIVSIITKNPGSYMLVLILILIIISVTAGFMIPPAFLGSFLRQLLQYNPYHILQQQLYSLFI